MAGRVTYKDLYSLVRQEIDKKSQFGQTAQYKNQTSRESVVTLRQTNADVTVSDITRAIQELLNETLPANILSGLEVSETSPISSNVNITAGTGTAGGKLYELLEDTTVSIPFDRHAHIFFVSLYENRILVEKTYDASKLTLAKIIVPDPALTAYVQNERDNSKNAYIINMKEYRLYGFRDKLEEDSIDLLRSSIGDILADNLIGNIRLSEDLKITNTAGSLELDSNSVKIYDSNTLLSAKFNRDGVFFYTAGTEVARFGRNEARIGNIKILSNAIQSGNFVSGSSGFRLLDNGDVEINNLEVRGTVYALAGEIGGWTIAENELYATTTGTIRTSATAGTGSNGVVLDYDGLRVYDDVLGVVANFPSDGSTPTISSGIITEVIFEISTNSVLRTSETVGDGSASSAGILINNTGMYGCGANQSLAEANLKALTTGEIYLSGEIFATAGQIGSVTITATELSGGTIEGAVIRGSIIESSDTVPRIRMDSNGLYYQASTSVGKYGGDASGSLGFKYGDGTTYGTGVLAYLFNESFPVLAIVSESDNADVRFYDRTVEPTAGTYVTGDVICVNGSLYLYDGANFKQIFRESVETVDLIIENRTSEPVGASTGRIWLRTDL